MEMLDDRRSTFGCLRIFASAVAVRACRRVDFNLCVRRNWDWVDGLRFHLHIPRSPVFLRQRSSRHGQCKNCHTLAVQAMPSAGRMKRQRTHPNTPCFAVVVSGWCGFNNRSCSNCTLLHAEEECQGTHCAQSCTRPNTARVCGLHFR